MSILTLNEAHEYQVEGKHIPGVTAIIADCGLMNLDGIDPAVLDYAAQRGTYVHQATALYDQKDLDEAKLDPALRPYLEAWKKFLFDSGLKINLIEERGYDKSYWFAGTVDRTGTIGRKKAVIDIKTGAPARWMRLQLAAYSMIWFPGLIPLRLTVFLHPDGSYNAREHLPRDFPRDKEIFVSALNVYQEKRAA